MLFISKLHISLSQHSQKRHQRDAEAGDDFPPFQFSTVMFRVCQEGLWGRTHLGEKGPSLPEQRESFGEVTTPPGGQALSPPWGLAELTPQPAMICKRASRRERKSFSEIQRLSLISCSSRVCLADC